MAQSRTDPLGFWRHALEFASAARAVRLESRGNVSLPAYYLLGHSVELPLKAFLLARGIPLRQLRSRSFGHDLVALLAEARRRRLGMEVRLTPVDMGVIQLLNYEYVAKRYEYRETGVYRIPDASLAQDVADRLVSGLKEYCEKRTHGPKHA